MPRSEGSASHGAWASQRWRLSKKRPDAGFSPRPFIEAECKPRAASARPAGLESRAQRLIAGLGRLRLSLWAGGWIRSMRALRSKKKGARRSALGPLRWARKPQTRCPPPWQCRPAGRLEGQSGRGGRARADRWRAGGPRHNREQRLRRPT